MTSRAMFSPPWKVFSHLELQIWFATIIQVQGMGLILNNMEVLQNSAETPEDYILGKTSSYVKFVIVGGWPMVIWGSTILYNFMSQLQYVCTLWLLSVNELQTGWTDLFESTYAIIYTWNWNVYSHVNVEIILSHTQNSRNLLISYCIHKHPAGLKTARAFSHFPFGHIANSLWFPYKSAFCNVIEKVRNVSEKWTENW